MDTFLISTRVSKAKRKAPAMDRKDNGSSSASSQKAKGKRRRTGSDAGDGRDGGDSKTAAEAAAPRLPSFQEAMANQQREMSNSRTWKLCERAERHAEQEHLDEALRLATRALVMCKCLAPLCRQFQDVGASVDAIDPIGFCSCRDFFAVAQTRRPRDAALGRLPMMERDDGGGGNGKTPGGSPMFPTSHLDLATVYALATNGAACKCGSGRVRCADADHLRALDRVATYAGKLGQHDLAYRAGEWYIDLAPDHAQGYLHMAKAVLAKGQTAGAGDSSAGEIERLRWVARCIYAHGVHNARPQADDGRKLTRALELCLQRCSTSDYLPDLPIEVVENILQHLSLRDLMACRRVSKRWVTVLRRVRLAIDTVDLSPLGARPRTQFKILQRLLHAMPGLQAAHLRIQAAHHVDHDRLLMIVLSHFAHALECLELSLRGPTKSARQTLSYPPQAMWPTVSSTARLRKLVLHNMGYNFSALMSSVLEWASPTLESLELYHPSDDAVSFPLPRLRTLKVDGGKWTSFGPTCYGVLPSLCAAAPGLEQLYVDGVFFVFGRAPPSGLLTYDNNTVLQSLHTLVVGARCLVFNISNDEAHVPAFAALPRTMRCIDLLSTETFLCTRILSPSHLLTPRVDFQSDIFAPLHPSLAFTHLEAFRCRCAFAWPERIFDLIGPSLRSPTHGRLAHLELNIAGFDDSILDGHAPDFDIPFPERLRTVGLSDFDTEHDHLPGRLRGRRFLKWVAQFRHAETICVYPLWEGVETADGGVASHGDLIVALLEQVIEAARKADEADEADEAERDGDQGDEASKRRPNTTDAGAKVHVPRNLHLRRIYQRLLKGESLVRARQLTRGLPIELPLDYQDMDFRPPVFPWPDHEGADIDDVPPGTE